MGKSQVKGKFLIDTNIAIYFLEGILPEESKDYIIDILSHESNLSVISKIELLSWNKLTTKQESKTRTFIQASNVKSLSDKIIETTIKIRKKGRKIKLPDAIIAATAMEYKYTLLTRNIKDFENIKGLKCLNPFDEN